MGNLINYSLMMQACKNIKTDKIPIWLMRQAGRYMESYRKIREKYSFMEICKIPELSAECTLQPIKKFNFDAAIIFSDILLLPEAMGIKLLFDEKTSAPIILSPIKERKDIESLKVPEPEEDCSFLMKAIKIVRSELDSKIPLIGFSGSPWTLAAFIIEGNQNKEFINTKRFLYEEPELFNNLLKIITSAIIRYLKAQIMSGANIIQIFDSLAYVLSKKEFNVFSLSYIKIIIESLKEFNKEIPVIIFAKGASHSLSEIKKSGCDVVSLDTSLSITEAIEIINNEVAIQGNLDPAVLLCKKEIIAEQTHQLLQEASKAKGYIFNLGHGILKNTPEENVSFLVECVREARFDS